MLKNVILVDAVLERPVFRGANLEGAILSGAKIIKPDLHNANVEKNFCEVQM